MERDQAVAGLPVAVSSCPGRHYTIRNVQPYAFNRAGFLIAILDGNGRYAGLCDPEYVVPDHAAIEIKRGV